MKLPPRTTVLERAAKKRESLLTSTTKPPRTNVNIENIPSDIKDKPRWVCWVWKWARKKWTKMPVRCDGSAASSTDANTWDTFDNVVEAYQKNHMPAGIGFVLGDGYAGVDLDKCYDPDADEADPIIAEVVSRIGSYTELSPSNTGVKILAKGSIPKGRRQSQPGSKYDVECYDSDRFFTITGQLWNGSKSIVNHAGLELGWFHQKYVAPQKAAAENPPQLQSEKFDGEAQTDEEKAREALANIPSHYADGYEDWVRVGMGAKSAGDLLNDWTAWSRQSAKFCEGECQKKWDSFGSNPSVRIGTLIKLAKESGWEPSWTTAKAEPAATKNVDDDHVEPFPVDLLPTVVQAYVTEGANARATDPSIVALPLLCTLASCIGTTRRIAPKPDWKEPPVLWGVVVGRSGSVKSPGIDLSGDLLDEHERQANRDHIELMDSYRTEMLTYEKELSAWKRSKSGDPPPDQPSRPAAHRHRIDDVTLEAVSSILYESPRGLLVMADELRGWLDGMGVYSSGGKSGRDVSRWLALHHCRPFIVDRKTNRESLYIPMASVWVAGTIQPGVLGMAMTGESVAAGLLARLLVVMPKPRAKRWTEESVTESTIASMKRMVSRLLSLEHAADIDGDLHPIDLPLTPAAKRRFAAFVNSHGLETIGHDDELAAAWSKLEGYALRLALVVHLCRWASGDGDCEHDGTVDLECIEAGIELSRWFGAEAERVYATIAVGATEDKRDSHVDRLAEWIDSRGGSATEREISRGPRRYRNGENVEDDCRQLIATGRAKWDNQRKTRRIVLQSSGDSGDTDTCRKNTDETAEVSPKPAPSVTNTPATLAPPPGDTSAENTKEIGQVTVSPLSPPVKSETEAKRIKVTL